MNKRERARLERRVERQLSAWSFRLGLYGWSGRVSYEEEASEDDDSSAFGTTMDVETRWEYKAYTVNVYLPVVEKIDDAGLEEAVVHELCHVIVQPLAEMRSSNKQARALVEMTVTQMTDAILRVHRERD